MDWKLLVFDVISKVRFVRRMTTIETKKYIVIPTVLFFEPKLRKIYDIRQWNKDTG